MLDALSVSRSILYFCFFSILQTRLLFGWALEVDINQDIIVTLGASFLSKYLSNLLNVSKQPVKQAEPTQTDWSSQVSQYYRVLLTGGLVRFVLWEKRKATEFHWDFVIIDLIQPHLQWSQEALRAGLNDLQVCLETYLIDMPSYRL